MRSIMCFFVITFSLIFFCSSSQAFNIEDWCKEAFDENKCYAAFNADELLTLLEEGMIKIKELRKSKEALENNVTTLKKTAANLRAANKELENRVLAWRKASEQWERTATDAIGRNEQQKIHIAGLKKEIALLEPGANRYQNFMQMFPQKNQ